MCILFSNSTSGRVCVCACVPVNLSRFHREKLKQHSRWHRQPPGGPSAPGPRSLPSCCISKWVGKPGLEDLGGPREAVCRCRPGKRGDQTQGREAKVSPLFSARPPTPESRELAPCRRQSFPRGGTWNSYFRWSVGEETPQPWTQSDFPLVWGEAPRTLQRKPSSEKDQGPRCVRHPVVLPLKSTILSRKQRRQN